eukprot:CAMPEP_0119259264 /NCGR_PEP_ID=MMETSP1329-20130426/150_1 /TAXON_ID=114041 /ORGANISM="Genus nov. species nov., Strain RCC1024" /LENGTH=338 /DNA_ID=CAMNT_0007258633 /DNA_START=93 /DNA_END=1109 /DNA_ORIENTATION=+
MARKLALLCAAAAPGALALVPNVGSAVARPTTALKVSYLSEVEDADKQKKWWEKEKGETESSNPRDHSGIGEVDSNYGPKDYVGFVDVEGFDGGDGQVGVVGDGKMKGGEGGMEEFDMSDAVKKRGRMNQLGGTESKLNAKNAWGRTTGYADELKAKGMVDYHPETGEDMLAKRRQQLENWRNQAELRLQKDHQMSELAALQGKEYRGVNHGSYLKQFDTSPTEVEQKAPPVPVGLLQPGELTDVITIPARLNGRGGHTLVLKNEFSTYNDFTAGFASTNTDTLSVEPSAGTLNRASGDPTEFIIKFNPTEYQESFEATLVIETDESKWTYDIIGRLS